jgi:hypothetical protein
MKRTLAFATLLGALSLVAALVSSSASAVSTASPTIPSHVGGVTWAIGHQPQVQGAGNLINHGGPTMTTNKTYTIFWVPGGYSIASGYDTTINQFFGDVAHDSGMGTNVYAVATQYSGIQYSSSVGGTWTDTGAFPASGCSPYNGLSECLTDAQIMAEVDKAIAANSGWVRNGTNMFFVFTPQNVGSCFNSNNDSCAYTAYCAYHGTSNTGATYANQPYAAAAGCDEGQYPNGASNQADPTINVVSHEHNEAITDPQLNAWYDAAGYENGDKCAWDFGALQGPNGSEYNQTINGHHYFLQREYSNNGMACDQTYSGGGGGGGVPKITSFSPSSGKRGITAVTINGQNLTGATWVGLVHGFASYKSSSWTVVSSTKITTTVPSNAATGFAKWKVTTPGGSSTSFNYFQVTG